MYMRISTYICTRKRSKHTYVCMYVCNYVTSYVCSSMHSLTCKSAIKKTRKHINDDNNKMIGHKQYFHF